jgi:hypothetical protein
MGHLGRQRPGPAPGALRFARYAYPPNALGYCGPADPGALLEAATGTPHDATLRHLAASFEGAWPYLQLIAASNHLADPLDPLVVEAYWVGNRLLERIPPAAFAASLADRFERRAGRAFASIAEAALFRLGAPHHSFHVFAVYPWLGLLRSGVEGSALTVLDRCRIRWGVVRAVEGDLAVVSSSALRLDGGNLLLGEDRPETVRWAVGGSGFAKDLAPGAVVSLHWDWVCEEISPQHRSRLERWTRANLAAANALARPGPAVVLDRLGS